jgi:hypothetical protein
MPEDRRRAGWEAIMQAGLATAAGKSRYALSNIAEGGLAGLSQYKESIKDLKKDEKERDKALMDFQRDRLSFANTQSTAALAAVDRSQDRYENKQARVEQSQLAAVQARNALGQFNAQLTQAGDLARGKAAIDMTSTRERTQAEQEMNNARIAASIRAAQIGASASSAWRDRSSETERLAQQFMKENPRMSFTEAYQRAAPIVGNMGLRTEATSRVAANREWNDLLPTDRKRYPGGFEQFFAEFSGGVPGGVRVTPRK